MSAKESSAAQSEAAQSGSAQPSPTAVKAAAAFVAAHGKPSRAVAENVGLAGVRVVLVGADGAMGDVMVAGAATAEALIERTEGLEAADWDRETVSSTKIGAAHRSKMAARVRG